MTWWIIGAILGVLWAGPALTVDAPVALAATAPVITSAGCPATASVGQPITCNPGISGTVTSYEWSAPTGLPAQGAAPSFTTTYHDPGQTFIVFRACNGTDCALNIATITVGQFDVPAISSLGCPAQTQVGQAIVCHPVTTNGIVLSHLWLAPTAHQPLGGDPLFTVTFDSPGPAVVFYRACTAHACSISLASINVVAVGTPIINALGCPTQIQKGTSVVCHPSLSGPVTSGLWFAPAGSPSTGTDATFTTIFNALGQNYIALGVCNGTVCTIKVDTILVTP